MESSDMTTFDMKEEVFSALGEGIFAEIPSNNDSSPLRATWTAGFPGKPTKALSKLSIGSEQINGLEIRDTDYLHKLTELEHRNNQLSVCKATLSEQVNVLEADYEKLKQERDVLVKNLNADEDKIKHLHEEIYQNNIELQNFEKQIQEITQQLDYERVKSQNFDSSQEKLIERIEEGHAKIECLEKTIEHMKRESQDASQTTKEKIQELESTNSSLEQELFSLRSASIVDQPNVVVHEIPSMTQVSFDCSNSDGGSPSLHQNIYEEILAVEGTSPTACRCERNNPYGLQDMSLTHVCPSDSSTSLSQNTVVDTAASKNYPESKRRTASFMIHCAKIFLGMLLVAFFIFTLVLHANLVLLDIENITAHDDLQAPWWRFVTITSSHTRPF